MHWHSQSTNICLNLSTEIRTLLFQVVTNNGPYIVQMRETTNSCCGEQLPVLLEKSGNFSWSGLSRVGSPECHVVSVQLLVTFNYLSSVLSVKIKADKYA